TSYTGAVLDNLVYDPYGNLTAASTGSFGQPLGYLGQFYDAVGRYHLGARYYDPTEPRFTQLDPSGANPGYVYAGDNPVNFSDPSGLCGVFSCIGNFFTNAIPNFFTGPAANFFAEMYAGSNFKQIVNAVLNPRSPLNRFLNRHGALADRQSGLSQYLSVYSSLINRAYAASGYACAAALVAASFEF
ncbi:MAG: RHS repeat-associated core domain-containing protein, partial [Acidimicrobiales bacterium]